MLPEYLTIEGNKVGFEPKSFSKPFPIPTKSAAAWTMRVRRWPGAELVLWTFQNTAWSETRDAHRIVLNGQLDVRKAAWMVAPHFAQELFGEEAEAPPADFDMIGALEGRMWTDPDYLAWWGATQAAQGPAVYKMDTALMAEVLADSTDVKVTRYGGSAGIEHFQPECTYMEKHGVSSVGYSWLLGYTGFQYTRQRHVLKNSMLAGLRGKPVPGLPYFWEWMEDWEGKNPGDLQHLDAKESYRGFLLTGDPTMGLAVLALWLTMAHHTKYGRDPALGFGGAVRAFGYFVELSAAAVDVARTFGLSGLAVSIRDLARAHIDYYVSRPSWPISMQTGSVPDDFRDSNGHTRKHHKPYQLTPVALGLERWARVELDPGYQTICRIGVSQIARYLEDHCYDPVGKKVLVAETLDDDEKATEWREVGNGTALWPLAALHMADAADQGDMHRDLLKWLRDDYGAGAMDTHKRRMMALQNAPAEFGYERH